MLSFLFRGLTAEPARATRLFETLTAEARQPAWYRAAGVPDTINGRFAVLATVTALTLVRLEAEGTGGNQVSVALTERFIEVMESEHREMGISDPTLGKTVRKLVAMLARRTELWRGVTNGEAALEKVIRDSLYGGADAAPQALAASIRLINEFRARLDASSLGDLEQGKIG
jgi:cytochrome b pre-mRNA-processing protein 3